MARPVAIVSAGMVTGVGLDAASTCAAVRCAMSNFAESSFYDGGGERQVVSAVPLERPWRGVTKLAEMLWLALVDCVQHTPQVSLRTAPLLLCVAETGRVGRFDRLEEQLRGDLERRLGGPLHSGSRMLAEGRYGGASAMEQARALIHDERLPACIVAGVDSLLTRETLRDFERRARLVTSRNSNGFIPGEAAGAVVLQAATDSGVPQLRCLGMGYGTERATVESDLPLRGDGLADAMRQAFDDASKTMDDMALRIADVNGEQYYFKEADLAVQRILRRHKEEFDIWHPADCIGEVGAATVPCLLGIML
ncbi:MAG: beta-ketoacyl synthase N-terminal-like domain-containing protein, partial [Pirellulaceae bacterium]